MWELYSVENNGNRVLNRGLKSQLGRVEFSLLDLKCGFVTWIQHSITIKLILHPVQFPHQLSIIYHDSVKCQKTQVYTIISTTHALST